MKCPALYLWGRGQRTQKQSLASQHCLGDGSWPGADLSLRHFPMHPVCLEDI